MGVIVGVEVRRSEGKGQGVGGHAHRRGAGDKVEKDVWKGCG